MIKGRDHAPLRYQPWEKRMKWEFQWLLQSGSYSTVSRSNWNLEMLVFVEGGKPEYPDKNPRSRDENQQQTQPTHHINTVHVGIESRQHW